MMGLCKICGGEIGLDYYDEHKYPTECIPFLKAKLAQVEKDKDAFKASWKSEYDLVEELQAQLTRAHADLLAAGAVEGTNKDIEGLARQIHQVYCQYYLKVCGVEYWTKGNYDLLDENTKEADRYMARFVLVQLAQAQADLAASAAVEVELRRAVEILLNSYEVWYRGTHTKLNEEDIQRGLANASAWQQGKAALSPAPSEAAARYAALGAQLAQAQADAVAAGEQEKALREAAQRLVNDLDMLGVDVDIPWNVCESLEQLEETLCAVARQKE